MLRGVQKPFLNQLGTYRSALLGSSPKQVRYRTGKLWFRAKFGHRPQVGQFKLGGSVVSHLEETRIKFLLYYGLGRSRVDRVDLGTVGEVP